jgi:hypothetical protein
MLRDVAEATTDPGLPLAPFWPLRGAGYDGALMVIGRSVNGWIAEWTAGQLLDDRERRAAVAWMRRDAQPQVGDRMAWVEDLWGASNGYNTRRSAFWRVVRDVVDAGDGQPGWSGRIVWSNLYKVAPAAGWNPGVDLQRAQRDGAIDLLRIELDVFQPRRVLAMTGGWIRPFVDGLGLPLGWHSGLVEATGTGGGCSWVVAKHPMGKPHSAFVAEVRAAFEVDGAGALHIGIGS